MQKKVAKTFISMLPQKAVSKAVGKFTRSKKSKFLIKPYSKLYKINTQEMEKELTDYSSMTSFFTRKLKDTARPIDYHAASVLSPVDGTISAFGPIHKRSLIQSKGILYTVDKLIGDPALAKRYENGSFLTIYLSPSDYHRIHMPYNGQLQRCTYIPGRLFPVNAIGVEEVKGLFTKNERFISHFSSELGDFALVKVGAFIVGSVKVSYDHHISYKKPKLTHEQFDTSILFKKGEEIGLFEFGSTVILLFEHQYPFTSDIQVGNKITMGTKIMDVPEHH